MNSLGKIFRLTSAGESHGPAYVGIIEGIPSGLPLSATDLQIELDRRRPGTYLSSPRQELDQVEILSGLFEGKTTGAPLAIVVKNTNQKSADYDSLKNLNRPGHADLVRRIKYPHSDHRGGGRFSARETLLRVAAGAVAKKILKYYGVEILGYVTQIGELILDPQTVDLNLIEKSILRVPNLEMSQKMQSYVEKCLQQGESVGSSCHLMVKHCPAALGSPLFDKMKAVLAHALFSVPAVMAVSFGRGEKSAEDLGSFHHDQVLNVEKEKIVFKSNHHGGILGGLTSGAPIEINVTLKPPASFAKAQHFWDSEKQLSVEHSLKGRFDPVLGPRFVPVGEAMIAMVLVDQLLLAYGEKQVATLF